MDDLKLIFEKLTRKRFLIPFVITIGVILVAINSYLLLKPSSKVERAYYLNHYEVAYPEGYEQFLTKDAILAAKETIYITEDATLLNDIRVKPGQIIQTGDELALYSEGKQGELTRNLEIEQEAYQDELENLNYVLAEIETMGNRFDPTSSIETEQLDDYISVTLEAEIMQEQSTSGAIAIIEQAIAATQRQLQIVDARLQDATISKAITSPISGSIGEIKQQDGKVSFEIHSEEKNLVAYINEEEWEKVQTNQNVNIFVKDKNVPLTGIITEKQTLPAAETLWYDLMKEKSLVQPKEIVYEIRVELTDLIETQPFATAVKSDIIIATYPESSIAPSTWAKYEDPLNEVDAQIYTLGYDGKIRLSPITILDKVNVHSLQTIQNEILPSDESLYDGYDDFNEDLEGNTEYNGFNEDIEESTEYDDFNEDLEGNTEYDDFNEDLEGNTEYNEEASVEESTKELENSGEKSSIKEEQLQEMKKILASKEKKDVVVFNRLDSQYTTILNNHNRNINAPAFLPFPMERFSFTKTGNIHWQDVMKFIFY